MSKNIILSEDQVKAIVVAKSKDNNGNKIKLHIDPNKVKIIRRYLDKGFVREKMHIINSNGYPEAKQIVGMIGTDGNVLRNMTDVQLFYLLQDRFSKLYDNSDFRDRLLKQIIRDWYSHKISDCGLLSVNSL